MTNDDRLWMAEVQRFLAPLNVVVDRPGGGVRRVPFQVYAGLMRVHRWCWVHGMKF